MPTKEKPQKKKTGAAEKKTSMRVAGTVSVLPPDEAAWKFLWNAQEATAELHDYHVIETPFFESANLVVGSMRGGDEDAVCVLKPAGGGSDIALRVSQEIGIVRSYSEERLGRFAQPLKVYSRGTIFSCEKQGNKSALRETYELGFNIVGDNDPIYDGQVITTAISYVKALKLKTASLRVNTLGCKACRAVYREKLRGYYGGKKSKICDLCTVSFDRGMFEGLACKSPKCAPVHEEAPLILDNLCHNCNNHFKAVLELLEDNGIAYEPQPRLSRALPYYTRTVFELRGAGNRLIAQGGRYDYLSEMLFSRTVPGVGVSFNAKNIIELLAEEKIQIREKRRPFVFFVAVGDQAKKASLRFMSEIRSHGFPVVESIGKKALQAQLRTAERCGAAVALIFGQREVFEGTIIIRDLRSGAQETIILTKLIDEVRKRLK
ncbi:MAG: ATP phosphoribosyltransferase regulatory subunit [Candidatus Jorgensenbacteria bacterium]|nr:ATP phosphoribosyltransferase regulatory subunit [Candidatus Jorgensenbacteria bacterium]